MKHLHDATDCCECPLPSPEFVQVAGAPTGPVALVLDCAPQLTVRASALHSQEFVYMLTMNSVAYHLELPFVQLAV
jgi:hypothetical protein